MVIIGSNLEMSDQNVVTRQQGTPSSLRAESVYKRVYCGGI